MKTAEKKRIDDWADAINNEEGKVLSKILQLIDHLRDTFHSKGKSHGNIRPESIILIDNDVIDFTAFDASQGIDCESPYASPEFQGGGDSQPSRLSDIYSITAVCYRAMSGQSPVKASNRQHRSNNSLHIPETISAGAREAMHKGLSMDAKDRPQSIDELRQLLESNLTDSPVQAAVEHSVANNIETHSVPQSPALELPKLPIPVKRLPTNLTSGQECRVVMDSVIPERSDWKVNVQANEALGVFLDLSSDELVFNPSQAGEHILTLELQHPEFQGRPALQKTIAVTVNPDPDSLWLNKASDPSVPYYKTDTDSIEVVTPVARILAASQRGRSHAHEGSCRDDEFLVRFDDATGWHLLTAADGAGSAKFSRQGSLIACTKAIEHMGNWLAKESENLTAATSHYLSSSEPEQKHLRNSAYAWLGGAAFEALKAIKAEAESREPAATVRDFHTTLLLAAAKLTPSGWLILTFSVGDGGIASVSADGMPVCLCTPDSGDFSGQTVFLTSPGVLRSGEDVASRIHIQLSNDLFALFLLTDGITDPKFPTEASFVDKGEWAALLQELDEKVKFGEAGDGAQQRLLSWLSFRSPGNHDDRTIVVLLNNPPLSSKPSENHESEPSGFLSRLLGGRNKKTDANSSSSSDDTVTR